MNIEFGPNLIVHPDDVSRADGQFPRSGADVSIRFLRRRRPKEIPARAHLQGRLCTWARPQRASATCASRPFGGLDFPGVEVHANRNRQHPEPAISFPARRKRCSRISDLFCCSASRLESGLPWCSRGGWSFGFALLLPFAGIVYFAFLHGSVAEFHRAGAFHARAQRESCRAVSRVDRGAGKTQSARPRSSNM